MINMMLLKTLHIIFMTAWFAGLFYLPRLFVYHAMAEDQIKSRQVCHYGKKITLWNHDS